MKKFNLILSVIVLSMLISCADDGGTRSKPSKSGAANVPLQTLTHVGVMREYILYVPDTVEGVDEVPLMLNFHGFGMTAEAQMFSADMRPQADSANFILVYPQGALLDGYSHWNAGLDTESNKSSVDDFGFIEALIAEIASTYAIDLDRVYVSGYSNGAFFAYALACFHSDKIAAIGSVAGTMLVETFEQCNPLHPTAMINIHGTADQIVPYTGGEGLTPIDEVIAYWTNFNQTDAQTVSSLDDDGTTIEHFVYADGNNNISVEHFKIDGGGHVWFEIDYNGSNTSQLIWDFVSQYDINGLRAQR